MLLVCLAAGALVPRGLSTTPAEYLDSLPKPHFRPSHTLPPLTRFGWTLPFDARVAFAEDWGYALEFGGYATTQSVAKAFADADRVGSRICALTASDPDRYPLCVIVSRDLPKEVPDATWTRTAEGELANGKKMWSPEAPDAVFAEAGALRAEPLAGIRKRCPIAVVLNGGEYALGVLGFNQQFWAADPRVSEAKGPRSWFDYVSARKAHQELIISKAVRDAVPERELYIYYPCGGGTHRNRSADWWKWGWGFEWMRHISDVPSNSLYYRHFNDGWTGANDLLTQMLNARGHEISLGAPLCYNWLCAGWPRDMAGEDKGLSDLPRYAGFLKCCYMAGMVGGNAGYYAYPKGGFGAAFEAENPPHWLRQMVVFGRVHALFSHLEADLRDGYLLPGPDRHCWSKDQPAYEFPTGDSGTRVLARRRHAAKQWLITAWAADGRDRPVTVTVPDLGPVELNARACGSVYRGELADGRAKLGLIDTDGMLPTVGFGTSGPVER